MKAKLIKENIDEKISIPHFSKGLKNTDNYVKTYTVEDMEQAYNDGIREGEDSATAFEWGSRHKRIDFNQWLNDYIK